MKYHINQNEIEITEDVRVRSSTLEMLIDVGMLIPAPEQAWPLQFDPYYFLNDAKVIRSEWSDNPVHQWRKKIGIFKTKQEAKAMLDEINAR